jgi:hypothetical protein
VVRNELVAKNPRAAEILRPFIQGRDIGRYHLTPPGDYLIYTPHGIDMTPYPAVLEHLKPFKAQLLGRATEQEWYELQQPQAAYVGHLENPKIVFPDMAISCRFTLDTGGYFGANTVYFLPTADRFLLGVLNSRAAQFYFSQVCAALEGAGEAYLRFFGQYLEQFPVPPAEPTNRDRLAALAERMLTLHGELGRVRLPHDRTALEAQIAATDRQIDRLVYDLYGLSDNDIRVVEGAAAPGVTAVSEV